MAEQNADPLGETARKERRALLGTASLGLLMVKAGVLPTEITALGIKFNETNQEFILWVFGGLISYFLIAFFFYGWGDIWQYIYANEREKIEYVRTHIVTVQTLADNYKQKDVKIEAEPESAVTDESIKEDAEIASGSDDPVPLDLQTPTSDYDLNKQVPIPKLNEDKDNTIEERIDKLSTLITSLTGISGSPIVWESRYITGSWEQWIIDETQRLIQLQQSEGKRIKNILSTWKLRFFFDFYLPIAFGAFSLFIVFTADVTAIRVAYDAALLRSAERDKLGGEINVHLSPVIGNLSELAQALPAKRGEIEKLISELKQMRTYNSKYDIAESTPLSQLRRFVGAFPESTQADDISPEYVETIESISSDLIKNYDRFLQWCMSPPTEIHAAPPDLRVK